MDLILGFFFGIVGSAYFVYGRKQQHGMALVSGVALMVYSMLVSGALWLIVLGVGFMVLPFVVSF
ncbi:MAG: amino acid transport protein [Gammaproteobacteria bacterium]|nr:amino acid transport protein [Gammaproteobacteria bacterium]